MEKKSNINKVMIIACILLLLTVLVTLSIILSKGKFFGKRLVKISGDVVKKEIIHSIEIISDKKILKLNETANIIVTIDGIDMQEGFEFEISDDTLVKIENNVIIPLGKEGKVVIVAKSIDYNIQSEMTIEIIKSIDE